MNDEGYRYRTHLLRVPADLVIATWKAKTWCGRSIPGTLWSRKLDEVDCLHCLREVREAEMVASKEEG